MIVRVPYGFSILNIVMIVGLTGLTDDSKGPIEATENVYTYGR